jgi:hypothetical protein
LVRKQLPCPEGFTDTPENEREKNGFAELEGEKGIRRANRNETAQIQKARLSFVEDNIPGMGICQSESIGMGELVDIQDELSGKEEHRWTPCTGGDALNVLMFDD